MPAKTPVDRKTPEDRHAGMKNQRILRQPAAMRKTIFSWWGEGYASELQW
jgi:hypothetical protein